MTQKNEVVVYETGLEPDKDKMLQSTFNPLAAKMQELLVVAGTCKVESVEDIKGMKMARDTRLGLKNVRVEIEKIRKEKKEGIVLEGRAIDGFANILKAKIIPAEKMLQDMEDLAKRIEEARIAALVDERTERMIAVEADSSSFDLATMTQDAFDTLLHSMTLGYEAKKKAEADEAARIKAEQKAKEKAEAEAKEAQRVENERIQAENEVLRKEKEAAEATAQQERAERERVENEAKEKEAAIEKERQAERQRIEREKKADEARKAKEEKDAKDAELARVKAEKEADEARKAAPDAEKLQALVDAICALSMPSLSSEIGMAAVHHVRGVLNGAVKGLRAAQKQLDKVAK